MTSDCGKPAADPLIAYAPGEGSIWEAVRRRLVIHRDGRVSGLS
jgi:hypothetical protein